MAGTSVVATAAPGGAVEILHPRTTFAVKPRVVHRRVVHRPRHRVVRHLVSAAVMRAWTRVAICEEGGNWHVRGPRFSGGLGISNANWAYFGGHQFAWNASRAT